MTKENNHGGSRSNAGRPALDDPEKRKGHQIRFSDAEWARIGELAEAAGILRSDYVRKKALEEG